MAVQQVSPVNCPNCNAQFTAPIQNIIDGQDMAVKSAFLQGQFNTVRCPQCGYTGAPSTPLYYFDLEKELALVFVPNQLGLLGNDQQKIIGDLTNRVIKSLPAEKQKFFLFNPKSFLTLDSMVKAILEADGITEDMIKAQEARIKLIEEFFKAPDEAALKEQIKAHDAELDREFFEILTAYMQTAQMAGDQQRTQAFLTMRTLTARWSSNGKKIVTEIDKELGLVMLESQEELLKRLQTAKDDAEFEQLIAAGHAFLDYGFFVQITGKIDEANKNGDTETAASLTSLREKILQTKSRQEEASKAALENAGKILEEILKSGQPDKVIDKHLDNITDAFFFVLEMNIEEATKQGHTDAAQAMQMIGNIAVSKLQQKHGPPQQSAGEQATQTPPPAAAGDTPKIHIARR